MFEDGVRDQLAERIRGARERKGLSLRAVASAIEVSPSTLSQIETGKQSPSVHTLYDLATYLNESIDVLLGLGSSDSTESSRPTDQFARVVQRADSRSRHMHAPGISWEQLIQRDGLDVEPSILTLEPATSTAEQQDLRYTGIEIGYVIQGEIQFQLGAHHTPLRRGDAYCIEGTEPHGFSNRAYRTARLFRIRVLTTPETPDSGLRSRQASTPRRYPDPIAALNSGV